MDMLNSFPGTNKPRLLRIITGLLTGPMTREAIDRTGGASNGPALVAELRALGLSIPCERRAAIDRDGKSVNPGVYRVTALDRFRVLAWIARRGEAGG